MTLIDYKTCQLKGIDELGPMLICFFFVNVNTEKNPFRFVTTTATNIP